MKAGSGRVAHEADDQEGYVPESRTQSSAWLLCPACRVNLVMAERQNVEIDYCPQCRGVWLDRGELDKIIEKSQQQAPAQGPGYPSSEHSRYETQRVPEEQRGYRRKSWLNEIFD